MTYQGVFFDFDYTLGDSTAAIAQGYQLGFSALGLPAPTVEQVRTTVGMTLENGFSMGGAAYRVEKGNLYLKVPPICAMILRRI